MMRWARLTGNVQIIIATNLKMIETAPPSWPFAESTYRDLARDMLVYKNDMAAAREYWKKADAMPHQPGMPERPWPFRP